MTLKDYIPGRSSLYQWMYQKGQRAILGDGDAICLIPYGDGVMARKRGYYHKNLIGNLPGYKTADGDIFLANGDGEYTFYLGGVPVVLCVDPSEMAAVVHPIKALISQKQAMGEYIRVDREGEAVSRGEALTRVDGENPPLADESPVEVNMRAHDELLDLSPPARLKNDIQEVESQVVSDGGHPAIEKADGFLVSANKAASIVPEPVTAKELKIMQQRERNAAQDTSQILKHIGYGSIIGCVATLLGVGVYAAAAGLL